MRSREMDAFKILGIFEIFWEEFFGRNSLEKLFREIFWRNFLEDFFGKEFLGRNFWEDDLFVKNLGFFQD